MLVPLSWLREFTPYTGTAQELGDRLTMLGLELEGVLNPFAAMEDIVTGLVVLCQPHPDSDHLHCCKVDIGTGELLDIVCGAPNVADGQKVAVAPVGARLPDGTVIKKARLRGKPSCGMICSERELGLSEDHSGIMVLPEATVIGEKLIDALELDREVLDISVTPNRPDCLSIIGIAREAAMAFGLPFHIPEIPLILDPRAPEITVPIAIHSPELCWLYSGRVINNVKVEKSPMRLRYRLLAVGIRPISNIVDVTNYILLETGQPLHSFDLDKLAGGKIFVRQADAGEKLTTLDGKVRVLNSNDLCICDAEKIVGLAGVMGGENTEITDACSNVFLESAVFNPVNIRKTSRRLGLASEASYRFERGVDEERTIWALDRACALMQSIGGCLPNRGFSVLEPKPFVPARIIYRPAFASALLGVDVPASRQKEFLVSVGCAVEGDGEQWIVIQPSWRPDLTREADLVEEVGRIYGLDTIEPELPPVERHIDDFSGVISQFSFLEHVRKWGSGIGLNEAINYSFVGQRDLDFLNMEKDDRIAIYNPLSEDQNVLRTCLAPGLLQALGNNLAFEAQSIKLFEVANAFKKASDQETGAQEIPLVGIILSGLRHEYRWPHKEEEFDYPDIKGLVENLLHYLGICGEKYSAKNGHPYLEPCVNITLGAMHLGEAGRVKPKLAARFNAQKPVWLAELNLARLRELHEKAVVKFSPLPAYPAAYRDITFISPVKIHANDILEKILLLKMPLLEGAVLIDCYEPEASGERHLTFRLTFRHEGRTLKDVEVEKEKGKIITQVTGQLPVRV